MTGPLNEAAHFEIRVFMRDNLLTIIEPNGDSYGDLSPDSEPESKRTIVGRVLIALGFDKQTNIISLSLEEPEPFFSADEIDSLVSLDQVKQLDEKDVPNWDIMFFNKKRVNRPTR